MKRLLILCSALFLVGYLAASFSTTTVSAQTPLTALQAYDLSVSPTFQHRLSVLLDAEATVVLREPNGTANHVERAVLAKNILYAPDTYAAVLARQIVFDTNLLTAGTTGTAGTDLDSSATDAAIRSQIATNWNAWCGV